MNHNNMDFWLNHLQQERRVDLQGTINEMARVSAIIYSIPALTLFIALLFPTWEGINKPLFVCSDNYCPADCRIILLFS